MTALPLFYSSTWRQSKGQEGGGGGEDGRMEGEGGEERRRGGGRKEFRMNEALLHYTSFIEGMCDSYPHTHTYTHTHTHAHTHTHTHTYSEESSQHWSSCRHLEEGERNVKKKNTQHHPGLLPMVCVTMVMCVTMVIVLPW